jgi:hypothetical protein
MKFHAGQVTPILRIFSVEKAREVYVGYPDCKADSEVKNSDQLPSGKPPRCSTMG